MPGDSRLCDAVLGRRNLAEPACAALAVGEQLEESATNWVAEYIERVHPANITLELYKSRTIVADVVSDTPFQLLAETKIRWHVKMFAAISVRPLYIAAKPPR